MLHPKPYSSCASEATTPFWSGHLTSKVPVRAVLPASASDCSAAETLPSVPLQGQAGKGVQGLRAVH